MRKKLGERLVESGLVTAEAVAQGLVRQKQTGHRLGDCLVEIGLLPESALLRFLSAELRSRFLTTDKLVELEIPPSTLDLVPPKMAETQVVLPFSYDPQ